MVRRLIVKIYKEHCSLHFLSSIHITSILNISEKSLTHVVLEMGANLELPLLFTQPPSKRNPCLCVIGKTWL